MEDPAEDSLESVWFLRVGLQLNEAQAKLLPPDKRFSGKEWARFFKCDMLKVQAASGDLTELPADLPYSVRALRKVTAGDGSKEHPIVWDGENAPADLGGQLQGATPRVLSEPEVLSLLERDFREGFVRHIQDQSSSPRRREEPIKADNDVVDRVGTLLKLEGYKDLALRGLKGLLALQSRSDKLQPGDTTQDDPDSKFHCGIQLLRILGAPGTGKSTALTQIWWYIHDHFDELIAQLRLEPNDPRRLHLRERVNNSLRPDLFLVFTFSNIDLPDPLPLEKPEHTGEWMATRMLFAMVGGQVYETFLGGLDPNLRYNLAPRHLMQFVQQEAGIGQRRGLVVFNFDECNVPQPSGSHPPTYFQHGLSRLVSWRRYEALQRFESDDAKRDLLPVITISGTHSSSMTMLQTQSGKAKIYDLGGPTLQEDSLLIIAKDAIARMASATSREVPESTDELLRPLINWLGWNPRLLVKLLHFAGAQPGDPRQDQVHVGQLWSFLQSPQGTRKDKQLRVLKKLEEYADAAWREWLGTAGDTEKSALFYEALAHTIIGRPVARDAQIKGANRTWGDAESDGFLSLRDEKGGVLGRGELASQRSDLSDLSDMDSSLPAAESGGNADTPTAPSDKTGPVSVDLNEGAAAPDSAATSYVYIPPLLLRVMYEQLDETWATMRSLVHLTESWEDREHSNLGLYMMRLQLARVVWGLETIELEEVCRGLSPLGAVVVPTDDYNVHCLGMRLGKDEFLEQCVKVATPSSKWAYMGPGNWGADGWMIFTRAECEQEEATEGEGNVGDAGHVDLRRKVAVFEQSKKRQAARTRPAGALEEEAGKCWDVPGLQACLLYLTDERARGEDNKALDVGLNMTVVPISRESRNLSDGVAIATLKRWRDVMADDKLRKKARR